MINLLKNELYKIRHKKILKLICILTVIFWILNTLIITFSDKIINTMDQEIDIKIREEMLDSYNLNNSDELEYYIEDKATIDAVKTFDEYDYTSWQRTYMYDEIYNKYIEYHTLLKKDNNPEAAEEVKKQIDLTMKELKERDWTYYIDIELKDYKETKQILEEQYNQEESEIKKEEIKKEIELNDVEIEIREYRKKYDIAPDLSDEDLFLESYYSTKISYLNTDFTKTEKYSKEREKEQIKSDYEIAKYKIENGIFTSDYDEVSWLVQYEFTNVIFFAIILIIIIASTILSEEMSKGTIKQLMIRPYKREKIILSKYLTCIIVLIAFLVFYGICAAISYSLAMKNGTSIFDPIIIYNLNTESIMKISAIKAIFNNFLATLPGYLIILTLSFFIGTLVENSSTAVVTSFVTYYLSSFLVNMASLYSTKITKFLPQMCWDLTDFLYGYKPNIESLPISGCIIICLITFILLFTGSIIVFKNKDIKNQ